MKVVIIAEHCFPKLSPRSHRTTELAKEFARQGYDVSVYALLGDYDYTNVSANTGVKFYNLGKPNFGLEDNIGQRNKNLFYRFISKFGGSYLFEFPTIELIPFVERALKHEGEIDLLITIASPHPIHWGTANFLRKDGSNKIQCWIADCGDPFLNNPYHTPPFYFRFVERKWCSLCDFISVPFTGALKGYLREFHHKIEVIPQGFDFKDVQTSPIFQYNEVPTFAFSGTIYKGLRDPTQFMHFLIKLDFGFKFVVYTNTPSFYDKFKVELGEKLELREYVPRKRLLQELSQMDFLINIKNIKNHQLPSKLIDYALCKRPILEISSNFNEGRFFLEFVKRNYSNASIIEDVDQYNIKNIVQKFLNLKILKQKNIHEI